jgi:hypothetical protein
LGIDPINGKPRPWPNGYVRHAFSMVFLPFRVFTSTESDEEPPTGPTQARQIAQSIVWRDF